MTQEIAAAADSALVGRCLDARYQIETVVGVGGLGTVYRALHTKLHRPVAIKVMHEAFGGSGLQHARFEREAKALAALQHPNIVSVLDYGVWDERPYLVMELLEGQTLTQLLHQGALPLERGLPIVQQMLEALSCMHRTRLVHRDLKPSNVFLQRLRGGQHRVKVLDFGLAKSTVAAQEGDPTLTREGAVVGTPAYMSPEQATGELVDARSDVYAVGVLMFRILSGRLPFTGDAIEQVRSHLIAPVPALERAQPDRVADAALEAMIRRAMAKRREERFADAGAMLQTLVHTFPRYTHARAEPEPAASDWLLVDALSTEVRLVEDFDLSQQATVPRAPRSAAAARRPSGSQPGTGARAAGGFDGQHDAV